MDRFDHHLIGPLRCRPARECVWRGRIALTPSPQIARVRRSWKCLDKDQRRGVVVEAKFLGKRNLTRSVLCPWLAATAGALATAQPARALEPTDLLSYSYGPVTLRPKISESELYNDNVYYRTNGPTKAGDLVSTPSAGFSLTLGNRPDLDPYNVLGGNTKHNYLSLDYNYSDTIYAKHTDLNGDDHSVRASLHLQGNRLSLTGSDQLEMATTVLGGGINYGSKTTLNTYQDTYKLSYALSTKTSVYVVGSHTLTDYAQGTPLFDNSTLAGTLGFSWQPLAKVGFFGETYYNLASVDPNRSQDIKGPDLTSIGGFVGMQGKFTERIMGTVKVGYETHNFSDHTPTEDSPVVSLQVSYRLGEKTRTLLTYSRSTTVSSQLAGAAATYDTLVWKLSHNIGTSGRWTGTVGADYQIGSFGSTGVFANRSDNWWHANCSLNYLIRIWMVTSLSYEFENFSSNARAQGIFDYSANRVTIKLSVGF